MAATLHHRMQSQVAAARNSPLPTMLQYQPQGVGMADETQCTHTPASPASTSQACSGCGVVVQKGVSVRWHECPDCGTSLHRVHNAAKHSERAGQALRGAVA